MGHLRQNMATKEWVIVSTERAKRPHEFAVRRDQATHSLPEWDADCPFCSGHEELDLELLRLPADGEWQVRVLRNKFPALEVKGDLVRSFDGVHRLMSGIGYHELVVDSCTHNACHARQTPAQVALVLEAFHRRAEVIASDPRIAQIIFFQNHGPSAGASLPHPHSQIVGLPIVPYEMRARAEEARRHYDDDGSCVLCAMLQDELADATRIVAESEHFVAFVPYAADSPFHTWILPRRHEPSFLGSTEAERADLGELLHRILAGLYAGLNDPDYNYILRTAPLQERCDYLHWYVTIVPRLTQAAGFELGSGMFINTVLPEECAAFLRAILADAEPARHLDTL